MREKSDRQLYFNWSTGCSGEIVLEYEARYNRVSDILDENPQILDGAHRDLQTLSRREGKRRKAEFTSENLLRALIVHQLEGTSLRKTMIRIAHSLFLQHFLRLGARGVPHFTLIDRAFKAVEPSTWKEINERLGKYAREKGRLDTSILRVDTTVVEANIHYPTDSSLLWDSWRVLYGLLKKAREQSPGCVESRFHWGKMKKLHILITRYASSRRKQSKRYMLNCYKKLIAQVERIAEVAEEFAEFASSLIASRIESYLLKVRRVLKQSRRAWVYCETVPARERIFSIFDDHVELIKRGRRHKPVEFGHKVLLGQTREKFITQYDVMEKEIRDVHLPERILERHKKSFGSLPEILVADKGFRGNRETMRKLSEKLKVVAIPERLSDFSDAAFVALQNFRAGIEGSISVLKRAFGLLRCRYRGFKSFECNVALGVFCHNLVLLSRAPT